MEVTNSNNKRIKIYQYLAVCLFVTNKRKNSWTDWARIFVGPHMTPRKVYGHPEFQNLPPKTFDCHKILRIHEKIWSNPRTFLLLFYNAQKPSFVWKQSFSLKSRPFQLKSFKPSYENSRVSTEFPINLRQIGQDLIRHTYYNKQTDISTLNS